MKRIFIAVAALFICCWNSGFAQMISGYSYMPGRWVEACQAPNGSLGANDEGSGPAAPTGYYPHGFVGMAFVYDYGHDGWTVGSPAYMGDFTLPGTPFEGWEVEIGGGTASYAIGQANYNNTPDGTDFETYSSAGAVTVSFTGANTSYTNTGGVITTNWAGTFGTSTTSPTALAITTQTVVDTEGSAIVFTVHLVNTSSVPLPNVYYFRSADPDNAETWGTPALPGAGQFYTDNTVVHQNEDATHRVMLTGIGTYQDPTTFAYDSIPYSYMALGTRDCRAVGMIYTGWPLDVEQDLAAVWSETYGAPGTSVQYTLDNTLDGDYGMALTFNLGTIAPGDSAIVSYAYIFNGVGRYADSGLEDPGVFPDPALVVDGDTVTPAAPVPAPVYDTFTTCSYPGLTSIPVHIIYGNSGDWTWSSWTWSPSTGLAATTGVTNTVNATAISGITTYTVTGSDSNIDMTSCNHIVFYLTVVPCFHATSNSPVGAGICLYNTLQLTAHGDSTDATYLWYGPGGFLSTGQSTIRTGLTLADTGVYYVVKTVGSTHDTVSTDVALVATPIVAAGSNAPVCSGGTNVLSLNATPATVGETFSWTGPAGFASAAQNPTIAAPSTIATGSYQVVSSFDGCMDTAFVYVSVDSTPVVPTVSSNAPICSHRDSLKFSAGDATTGTTYSWTGPGGFTSLFQNPVIPPDVPVAATGTYTVTAILNTDGFVCNAQATLAVVVDSTPYLPVVGSNGPDICSGTALLLTATSSAGSSYNWTGPDLFTSNNENPTINPAATLATGTYYVAATIVYPGIPAGCTSDTASISVVVDSTPVIPAASSNSPGPPGPVVCQGDTLELLATDATAGVSYTWTGPFGYASTDENPLIINVSPSATGSYTVTASLGMCSSEAVVSATVTPSPPLTATNNGPVCTGVQDTLILQAYSEPGATYSWMGPYTFFSSNPSPTRTPVVAEYAGVYQVTAFLDGCSSAVVNDTVIVRQTPNPPGVAWPTYCQGYNAFPLQAMGDSILWYPSVAADTVGTLTAPVPQTDNIGILWYYVSQTIMGCTSYIDSMRVVVNPKPVVTVTSDTGVCPHDSLVITALDTDAAAYYHWAPFQYITDSSSPSITVKPETNVTYTLTVTNQYDCTDTTYTTVNVYAAALLNLGDSVTLFPGQSYQFDPLTNCTQFSWFPPNGLSSSSISNPVATPEVSTIYIVQGETSWGCVATDSVSIYVNPESSIVLPNAFTPGSGANSEFKILQFGTSTLNYFRIFDRWGVKVFETTDVNQGWDGTYNGTPQPFGVYVYEVSATTSLGAPILKHGNVTLIR